MLLSGLVAEWGLTTQLLQGDCSPLLSHCSLDFQQPLWEGQAALVGSDATRVGVGPVLSWGSSGEAKGGRLSLSSLLSQFLFLPL